MKRYYIAYGSNLSTTQMARRCPGAMLVGTGILDDYLLEFRTAYGGGAFATITPVKGAKVPIAIFEIKPSDEINLDIYEGVRGGHYFKEELNIPLNGKEIKAMVYRMNLNATLSVPSQTYINVVLEGYHEHGFDEEFILNALARIEK